MIYKINKKGFTLMELLVTVVLVAIIASYAVYQYSSIMDEGRVKAAKGKLAALGGATARFLMENAPGSGCDWWNTGEIISPSTLADHAQCVGEEVDHKWYMYDVFACGYAERSLGLNNHFNFYFGCPSQYSCGNYDSLTVFMKPKPENASNSNFPSCAYFDPETDKVVEVQ